MESKNHPARRFFHKIFNPKIMIRFWKILIHFIMYKLIFMNKVFTRTFNMLNCKFASSDLED